MSNLTTRKIVLGMLMVLVLAFSVQGIAEALTFSTSKTGDLETKAPNEQFTIRFSVSLKGNTAIKNSVGDLVIEDRTTLIDSSGYQLNSDGNRINADEGDDPPTAGDIPINSSGFRLDSDGNRVTTHIDKDGDSVVDSGETFYTLVDDQGVEDTVDSSGYSVDGSGDRETPLNKPTPAEQFKVSDAVRYHYTSEAIKVDVEGNARIVKVGSRIVNIPAVTDLNMYERSHASYNGAAEHEKLSGSVSLVIEPTGTVGGVVTVTVTDETPTSDAPDNGKSPPITFTLYSVKYQSNITDTTNVTNLARDGVGSAFDNDVRPLATYFTFVENAEVPVHYSIDGSGTLSIIQVYSDTPRSPTSVKTASKTLSTSSSAPVFIDMRRGTSKVTTWVSGGTSKTMIFIYQGTTPAKYPKIEITQGNPQVGAEGGQLEEHLEVKVTDGNRRPLSGVAVKFETTGAAANFIPVPDTRVYTTGSGIDLVLAAELEQPPNDETYLATPTLPGKKTTPVFVQTDRSGVAKVYYELDSNTTQTITASLEGADFTVNTKFTARVGTTGSTRVANLEIVSGNPQSAAKGKNLADPLVVIARSTAGYRIPNVVIQFRTNTGTLSREGLTAKPQVGTDSGQIPTDTPNPDSGQQIYVFTGSNGQASVDYNIGQLTAAREVVAEVRHESRDSEYSFAIDRVTFNINGRGGTSQPSQPSQPAAGTDTITLTLSSTTGEPGDEIDVTVTSSSSGDFVVIDNGDFSASDFDDLSGRTPHETTLTLPDEEGEYDFFAVGPGGVTSNEVTVTVETGILGEISISQIGTPSNGAQSFSITVVDTDSARISGSLTVRVSGSGFTTRNVDTLNGVGNARLTLPTAASLYTLTASAEGYTSGTTQVRIAGTGQQEVADEDEEEVEEEVTVAAEPDSIEITGPAARSGTVNEELEAALIVRVLDDDGDGIEDARVFYRVIEGRGRISDGSRGGRRIGVVTDDDGYARVNFTPTDGGTHTIRVNTDDLSATVEFTITTGAASGARDAGTGGTSGASIIPVVHVVAASRPPMLWVDGGAIYALVGASPQRFAPDVDNALNITVAGGKVYWTEKTGENSGTINSADLDGTGVRELVSVRSVPMGIAVDTAGRKVYWTASSGKIKQANLNGSGSENVMLDLPSPMDLALAGGNAYWTQGNGSVRFVNLRGQKVVRNVSTGSDTPGSLAIAGGKVYWTEKTAASAGTINSANLNGTDVRELTSIRSVPMGIAVDTARSKLYWTASSGKIKQANLNGSGAKNVVDGLGSPGELVLSNSIAAPAGAGSSAGSGKTASGSKYDVNGDGTVDIGDSDALTIALAANSTDPKYDVDGNGKVDIFDLIEVRAKYSPGAAGAPTLFGMKLSAVQIDRLQEQIDLLIATNDRSPAAMRTLVYLQQLLVTARPEKTQLLANYPNPFNPETWIPYELATDTDVRLTIYNTQGVVIRSMPLGHQSAGYYTGRDRAAYWDGRNALGEQVASGLYFYQLETDEMSLMRKMVILK